MKYVNEENFKPQAKRTFGRTMDCKGCRFWSELIAKQEGHSTLKSFCLNKNSRSCYTFTRPDHFCDQWGDGEYGAIDDPNSAGAYDGIR